MKTKRMVAGMFTMVACLASSAAASALTVQGYWRMGDDDSGAVAGGNVTMSQDITANGHHLALSGSVGSIHYSSDVPPILAEAGASSLSVEVQDSSSGNFLYCDNTALRYGNNWAMECWVKATGTLANSQILMNGRTNALNNGWRVNVYNGTGSGLWWNYDGINSVAVGTFALPTNVWVHLAFVCRDGVNTLYKDGEAWGTVSSVNPGTPMQDARGFAVGLKFGTGARLLIDDVRVITFDGTWDFNAYDLLWYKAQLDAVANRPMPTIETRFPGFMGKFGHAIPRGWYLSSTSTQSLDDMAGLGVDFLIKYGPPTAAWLDSANSRGIKVWLNVPSGVSAPSASKTTQIVNFVNAWKGHPAVAGWYSADEPSWSLVPPAYCIDTYNIIKGADTSKPVWISDNFQYVQENTREKGLFPDYDTALDMFSSHPYPWYGASTGEGKASDYWEFGNRTRVISSCARRYGKPWWHTLQSFAGGGYDWRLPSLLEYRHEVFAALIWGAEALNNFHYETLLSDPKVGSPQPAAGYAWLSNVWSPVNAAVDQIENAVAAGPVIDVLANSNPAMINAKVYQDPLTNRRYLLSVNERETAQSAVFTLIFPSSLFPIWYEPVAGTSGTGSNINNNAFAASFGLREVKAYRLYLNCFANRHFNSNITGWVKWGSNGSITWNSTNAPGSSGGSCLRSAIGNETYKGVAANVLNALKDGGAGKYNLGARVKMASGSGNTVRIGIYYVVSGVGYWAGVKEVTVGSADWVAISSEASTGDFTPAQISSAYFLVLVKETNPPDMYVDWGDCIK